MGMLNRIVLFPLVFVGIEEDLWGLIELFIVYATVISSVSNLGRSKVLQRYLPGYKGDTSSLLAFAWRGTIFGSLLTLVVLVFLRTQVSGLADDPALFSQYYWIFILIVTGMIAFEWSSGVLIAKFRTHLPMVFNQFILRLYVLVILLAKWWDFISITQLLYLIGCGYVVVFGVMSIIAKREEPSSTGFKVSSLPDKRKINDFGLFSMVNGSSSFLFQNIDSMVLGAFSLSQVAILAVAKNIANVFFIPGRSLVQSLNPVVSKAFQENEFEKLHRIYKKSAAAELFVGGFIFLLIWANLDLITLPLKSFADGNVPLDWVVLAVGVGKLVTMAAGVSNLIIARSQYYRFTFVANLLLVGVSVGIMFLLIPDYGILGAAIAQGGVMTLNAIVRIWFIRRKLHLSPLSRGMIPTALIVSVGLILMIPEWTESMWFGLLLNNAVFAVLILISYKFFPPIDDISNMLTSVLGRFRKKKA